MKEWKAEIKGLWCVHTTIVKTIGSWFESIETIRSVRECLRQFKTLVESSEFAHKKEITDAYNRLVQKGVKSSRIMEWAVELETVLQKAEVLDLGLLKEMRPFQDVLRCLNPLDPGWAGHWMTQLMISQNRKADDPIYMVILSVIELLRQFRSEYSQEKTNPGGSFLTFQGEEASVSYNKAGTGKKKCLDGKPGHDEAGCYHLYPGKRPDSYNFVFGHNKALLKALDTDSGKKEKYRKVYTELTVRVREGRDSLPGSSWQESGQKEPKISVFIDSVAGDNGATDTPIALAIEPRPSISLMPTIFQIAYQTYLLQDSTILEEPCIFMNE